MTAPQAPRIVGGRYRVVRTLGAGAHGTVDLAEDLLNGGRRVAVKRLEAIVGAGDPEPAAEILRWMLHPSWAEILDEGRLDEHGRFQVSRYVPGHSLDRIELPRPVEEVMQLLEDGARVLRALHWRGLIHYDVTPGNWLREETPQGARFTLTDGGLASLGAVRGFARGSPAFMAPEVLEGTPHDHRADLYSLGLVAWRALTGRDPHGVGGAGEILGRRRRVAAPALRSVRPDAPAGLERILAALLERDPSRRPSDDSALLSLLAEAGWAPAMEDLRPEEAASAAEGGAFVGRGDVLVRFRTACQTLASDAPPASDRPAPTDPVHSGSTPAAVSSRGPTADTVLLLHGPSGSGGTRLAQELAARARTEGIATLSLSAREGAADRRSILRRIADGLGGLLGRPILLGAPREGSEAAERAAAADARATEMLVEACEQVAGEVPFVLVIEDFSELPGAAKESLRVLVRHLLARSEHLDGRRPPRLLLVIDHGPDDPGAMLIPDSVEPRRPVVELPPLSPTEVGALIADRLPGIELPATDLEAIHRACGGLPRMLTALLSEGLRRRDVRTIETRWIWMVEALRSYRPARTLPPSTARALEAIDSAARDTLVRLSLLDDPATDAVAEALADNVTLARLVSGGLLTRSHVGDEVRYAPASRALRDHLREDTPEALERHRRTVLSVLTAVPQPDLVVDEARLRADLGEPSLAIERLAAAAPTLSPSARLAATTLLADVVEAHPSALASAAVRAHGTQFLLPGPAGGRLADAIFRALPSAPDPADDETRIRLAEDAYARAQYARALSMGPGSGDSLAPRLTARLALVRLRSSVAQSPMGTERPTVAAQARLARTLDKPARIHLRLILSRWHFHRSLNTAAQRHAERSLRLARRLGQPTVLAQALNAAAIAEQASGSSNRAETLALRAIRVYRYCGEIGQARRGLHNIARLQMARGANFDAIRSLSTSLALSNRYNDHETGATVLRSLSTLYDASGNPYLSYQCLHRMRLRAEAGAHWRLAIDATLQAAEVASAIGWLSESRRLLGAAASLGRDTHRLETRARIRTVLAHHALYRGELSRAARLIAASALATDDSASLRCAIHFLSTLEAEKASRLVRSTRTTPFRSALSRLVRVALQSTRVLEPRGTELLVRRALAGERSQSGRDNRLLAVCAIALTTRLSRRGLLATPILSALAQDQARRGHATLYSRVSARQALFHAQLGDLEQASACLDDALALLALRSAHSHPSAPPVLGRPTPDHLALARFLSPRYGSGSIPTTGSEWRGLLLPAYQMTVASRASSSADGKVNRTLRKILAHSARLQTGVGLEALLDSLNSGAREITQAERSCLVLIASDPGREIRVVSSASRSTEDDAHPRPSQTIIQRVLTTRRPILVHDVFADSELMTRPSVTSLSLRSVLCVPLLRGNRLFGAMYADSSAGAGTFDNTDLEILSLFAEQAAAAIESARLLGDVQRSYSELRSAQDRLVRGERLRVMGELAGGVAHEFNNLLTSILARVQLLSLEPLSSHLRHEIGMIQKASLDAAEVVRRLQSFSRNQRQGDFQRVDLAEICADVVEFLRPLWTGRRLAGRAPVSVLLRTSKGHIVLGDPTELREVVTNVLKNAVEATEAGGTVSIETRGLGSSVALLIRDDGAGVSPEARSKLFTPFFTTKGDKGTGLGLCLSQQIVERHGGQLRLEPGEPRGTVAVIELPLPPLLAPSQSSPQLHSSGSGTMDQISVLVVDDDRDVLEPLARFLRRSGFTVRSAGSGLEAMHLLRSACPDVLITDIGMPDMDGWDLCRSASEEVPGLPIILMTGRESSRGGGDASPPLRHPVVAKPFTMRQITDAIASVVAARQQSRD